VSDATTASGREPGAMAVRWTVGAIVGAALFVLLWSIVGHFARTPRIGDGVRVESYGFDLSNLSLDRSVLAASGHSRDFLPALDDPPTLAGREVAEHNRQHRRRPVVSADRVVGVVVGGESRAYPLPLLEAHEIVNDTLGGIPIAVSFSPLADAAVVFDRRVGGVERRFGVSGLMWNATHLLYDRSDGADSDGSDPPSLLSPLLGAAVAGPLAGERLQRLPAVGIARWDAWLAAHPETTVAMGDGGSRQRGRQINYARYLESPGVPFPVLGADDDVAGDPSPGPPKDASLLWRVGDGGWSIATLADLAADADAAGWTPLAPGVSAKAGVRDRTLLLRADEGAAWPVTIPCMAFAAEAVVRGDVDVR
jgi:hypothetical protein